MNLGENGGVVTRKEYEKVRNYIVGLWAVTAICVALASLAIVWVRTDAQGDVRRVACANSQSQVTGWEFLKLLAAQNQTGTLMKAQIQQRKQFYDGEEQLSHQRAGDSCQSLHDMKAQSKADIQAILG